MSRDELSDLMHGEDRVLTAAWMLPADGPLSDEQRRDAMENFVRYIKMHLVQVFEVARQVGKPTAAIIRELMGGHYRAEADESIRRLNMWIEQDARRRASTPQTTFVETKVAKDLFAVARIVREQSTMGMAVGASGIGKTHCAIALRDKFVGAVYVRVMRGSHTASGLLSAIAGALDVRIAGAAWSRKRRTQLERVIETLADSGRLVIIDEAHKLSNDAIELLRDIHDTTACPMLLLATKDLHDRIVQDADPDHGQVYSRFGVVVHFALGHDTGSGGKPLYSIDDIRALYNEPQLRLATDAARYLTDLSNRLGEGSLRRCKALVVNAARRARHRQGLLETDAVTVTADDLAWVEATLRQGEGTDQRERVSKRLSRAAVGG
jgi:DNA transposition AAA+ family ATPase